MKILILTSIYPEPDDKEGSGVTPVVHYFAKEWVKLGNEVIVIHNSNRYPNIIYKLNNNFIEKINSKFAVVIPEKEQGKELFSIKENVKIYRLPMKKAIPKMKFSERQIKHQYDKILSILKNEKFIPDIILGHWENPQIPLVSMLRNDFNCKSAVVFHGINYIDKIYCKKWKNTYINNIDLIGCRCKSMSIKLKKDLNLNYDPFICYSGIPDNYLQKKHDRNNITRDRKNIDKYIYVGRLISRKNVDSIIEALNLSYPNKNFTLTIIGIGAEEKRLKELVEDLNLKNQIEFLGRCTREEIIKKMELSDYFIMISKNEVFGLVYLEAMYSGCITIGSKNEGIDGIICNGKNGFLCESGNVLELSKLINEIKLLSDCDKNLIIEKAIKTVNEYSDSKVAKKYLEIFMENNRKIVK
ncbi:glycosyltransferase [Clostridium perfringens]